MRNALLSLTLFSSSAFGFAATQTVTVGTRDFSYVEVGETRVVARSPQSGSLVIDAASNPAIFTRCSAIAGSYDRLRPGLKNCDLTKPDSLACRSVRKTLAAIVSSYENFTSTEMAFKPTFITEDNEANQLSTSDKEALAQALAVSPEQIVAADTLNYGEPVQLSLTQDPYAMSRVIGILTPELRPAGYKAVEFQREGGLIAVQGLDVICDLKKQEAAIVSENHAQFKQSSGLEQRLSGTKIWSLYQAIRNQEASSDALGTGIRVGLATARTLKDQSDKDQLDIANRAVQDLFEGNTLIEAASASELLDQLARKSGVSAELDVKLQFKLQGE